MLFLGDERDEALVMDEDGKVAVEAVGRGDAGAPQDGGRGEDHYGGGADIMDSGTIFGDGAGVAPSAAALQKSPNSEDSTSYVGGKDICFHGLLVALYITSWHSIQVRAPWAGMRAMHKDSEDPEQAARAERQGLMQDANKALSLAARFLMMDDHDFLSDVQVDHSVDGGMALPFNTWDLQVNLFLLTSGMGFQLDTRLPGWMDGRGLMEHPEGVWKLKGSAAVLSYPSVADLELSGPGDELERRFSELPLVRGKLVEVTRLLRFWRTRIGGDQGVDDGRTRIGVDHRRDDFFNPPTTEKNKATVFYTGSHFGAARDLFAVMDFHKDLFQVYNHGILSYHKEIYPELQSSGGELSAILGAIHDHEDGQNVKIKRLHLLEFGDMQSRFEEWFFRDVGGDERAEGGSSLDKGRFGDGQQHAEEGTTLPDTTEMPSWSLSREPTLAICLHPIFWCGLFAHFRKTAVFGFYNQPFAFTVHESLWPAWSHELVTLHYAVTK